MINGLRITANGLTVLVNCPSCKNDFETDSAFVAGIFCGELNCTHCGEISLATPQEFLAAVSTLLPEMPELAITQIENELRHVLENWYRNDLISGVLFYKGINLGQTCQRQLSDLVAFGLYLNALTEQV